MEISRLMEFVQKHRTPCYIFDLDCLKKKVDMIKENLGVERTICYAMKANPFLIGPMNAYMDRFEVCSPGEYEICMRQGIHPDKIVISGVNKTRNSMERILELGNGQGIFTIESKSHVAILSELVKEQKKKIKVFLRLSSGNQFGMDKNTLEETFAALVEQENIEVRGLHYYSGTQKKLKKVEKELNELCEYAVYLKEKFQISDLELEYGPGLSVAYFDTDKVVDGREQLQQLKEILQKCSVFSHISIEMGRFIASECGSYMTSIVDVKKTEESNFLIVDGGIHQVNYYGQLMGMKKPGMMYLPERQEEKKKWTICGSLCTINDVIVRDVEMGTPEYGDVIVFHTCGAYSVTEGMALFLSRELPAIYFYSDNEGFSCVRKHMGTDIINNADREERNNG